MCSKKKIIFVTEKLIMGGVEKSLLELIKILSPYMEITVAVMQRGGELELEICKYADVKLLLNDKLNFKQIFIDKIRRSKIVDAFHMIRSVCKSVKEKSYIRQCTSRIYEIDKINEYYDFAVCYHKPTDILVPFTALRINAKNKIIWFHTEILETVRMDEEYYKRIYELYDSFVCVSESVHLQLNDFLKNRKSNIYTIYNYIDEYALYSKSKAFSSSFRHNQINIVTVGRLSKEKGQDIAIKAAQILKDKSINFTWYLIGDGPYYAELFQLRKKLSLENHIRFLGYKENPYPYIKDCDIYVQPSREEGYGLSVAEAKLFQRPVIVTNFLTATEHIDNGKNGYIVSMDEKELSLKIIYLIENPKERKKIMKVLKNYEYSSQCEKRIFNLFGIKMEEEYYDKCNYSSI